MPRHIGIVLLVVVASVAGCDVGLESTTCLLDRQCTGGQVCVEGACVAPDADAGLDTGADGGLLCGNGTVDDGEACDEGDDNDDRVPNACRTDCTLPTCGDGVVDDDYDEACDDGDANRDDTPNACRTSCQDPSCGDGVVDDAFGEACDPAVDGVRCQVECEVYYESLCDPCTTVGAPCGEREEDMRCLADPESGDDGVCAPECETSDDCPLGRDCLYSAEFDIGICILEIVDCLDCSGEEICDDGQDNDCNGTRDCGDPACADDPACAIEVCDDGADNDGDGAVDCDDEDCLDDEACGRCEPDYIAGEGPAVWSSTLAEAFDIPAPPCATLADRGFLVDVEVPTAGRWRFDLAGSDARAALAIANDACGSDVVACSDQADLPFFGSLYLDMGANDVVTLVVAPLEGTAGDRIVLNAIPDEAGEVRCTNGEDDDGDGATDCDDPRCSDLDTCRACTADSECGDGSCRAETCECPVGAGPDTWCGGECVNLLNDTFNCGACDNVCPTFACRGGECLSGACLGDTDLEILDRDEFEPYLLDCYESCGLTTTSFGCIAVCLRDIELSPGCTNCFVGSGICAAIFCGDACTDPGSASCAICIDELCQPALEVCAVGGR